uniref:OSJNBa0086B14.24 protein n=1 Tax=Oryza sativa subsp. japonica TaxID=39947 RepID=Q7XV35_ORYSJ|nr:OSJNBa0086B14.24 [Oryza sativa Japonica Group]
MGGGGGARVWRGESGTAAARGKQAAAEVALAAVIARRGDGSSKGGVRPEAAASGGRETREEGGDVGRTRERRGVGAGGAEESGSKIVGDVMYGDENVEELTDGEEDARDQSASEGLRGENLAPLPVLATATPSDAIHLLEGVAFGALILTPLQGNSPGENLRFVRIGRCRRSIGITFLKDSF